MKTFFSIMLIFLFLSCGGGKKTPESVIPDKDSVSDGDITEVDESADDENSLSDADEDTETVSDTCEADPCKDLENSTGKCIDEDKGYFCECLEKYGWSPDDKKCLETRTAECTGLPENAFVLFLVPVESILSADKMNDGGMVHCVRNID